MEQKLFIAACVMYVFSWISKRLFRKNKPATGWPFGLWHAAFLFLILSCVYMVVRFIADSSAPTPQSTSGKTMLVWVFILAATGYGFFSGRKKEGKKREHVIKVDMDWANTVYFAGFVASIVMFFLVQAFKIPSASMYNTLQIGDHLFVNKAAYGFRIPLTNIRFGQFKPIEKGDIIVFSFPADRKDQVNCGGYQYGRDYVKRVIALPGDKVEVRQGELYINDKKEPLHGYEVFRVDRRMDPVVAVDMLPAAPDSEVIHIAPAVYQALWEGRTLEHELGLSLRDNFGPVVVPEGQYFGMGDNRDDSCDSRFWGPIPRENIKGTAWFIHWPLSRIRLIK